MSNQQGHVSYVKLMRFIVLFTFSHGGNRNQQWGEGGCHFDVESGTFKGKFGTLMWPSFICEACIVEPHLTVATYTKGMQGIVGASVSEEERYQY